MPLWLVPRWYRSAATGMPDLPVSASSTQRLPCACRSLEEWPAANRLSIINQSDLFIVDRLWRIVFPVGVPGPGVVLRAFFRVPDRPALIGVHWEEVMVRL